MKFLGAPGKVTLLDGYLEGPGGQIPIEMFSSDNTVGRIAIARVSVPPQYAQSISDLATTDKYKIMVGEKNGAMYNVFTGYISGKFTRFHSGSIRTGLDLIHPARDLDQMRLAAPGLHCGSVADMHYYRISTARSSAELGPGHETYFEGSGNIVTSFIQGLSKRLTHISSLTLEDPYFEGKKESLAPCIAMLNSIKVINGNLDARGIIQGTNNPVNKAIKARVEDSFHSYASIWDTVNTVLSDFGMLLICNPDGTISASVDLGGVIPNEGNYLDGENITLFDSSSAFYRNVKSVVLVSHEMMSAHMVGDASGKKYTGIVVGYPNPEPTGEQGATVQLHFPRWLDNLAYAANYTYRKKEFASSASSLPYQKQEESLGTGSTTSQRQKTMELRQQYAKMLYCLERNKMRTFSVTSIMAPTAIPGTTATIAPWGNVIPFGAGEPNLDMSTIFSGYCCTVQHLVDVQARNVSTTFTFRNVTSDFSELVEKNPLFSDASSFAWD